MACLVFAAYFGGSPLHVSGGPCSVFQRLCFRGSAQRVSGLSTTEFGAGVQGETHQVSGVAVTGFRDCVLQFSE